MTDMRERFRSLWRKLFTLEQWRIGIANCTIDDFLAAPGRISFRWIGGTDPRVMLADPFAVETKSGARIFAERLVHGRSRGELVEITGRTDAPQIRPFHAAPHHLSYPFTLSSEEGPFLVPEQAHSGHVAFYRYGDAIDPHAAATIDGLDALDSTLIAHEGKWWLFCTRLSDRPGEALHLYHADEVLGPYVPHPLNPVVIDRARARPAGRIIRRSGKLLRPGQDGRRTYGGAITLCEIEVLTTADYRERPIATLEPAMVSGAWPDGLHTLEHTAHHVLVDTKRFAFHPFAFVFKLIDRVARRNV